MNATDIFKALKKEEGSVLRGVTPHAFCRLLPALGKRVHTKWANGYYVVKITDVGKMADFKANTIVQQLVGQL
jgi:hypothetical protein